MSMLYNCLMATLLTLFLIYVTINLLGLIVWGFFIKPNLTQNGITIVSAVAGIGFIYVIYQYIGWIAALAILLTIISRLPDLLWEIRNGRKITRTNSPQGLLYIATGVLSWVDIPLLWWACFTSSVISILPVGALPALLVALSIILVKTLRKHKLPFPNTISSDTEQLSPQEREEMILERDELKADRNYLEDNEQLFLQKLQEWTLEHPGEEVTDEVSHVIIRTLRLKYEIAFYDSEILRLKQQKGKQGT